MCAVLRVGNIASTSDDSQAGNPGWGDLELPEGSPGLSHVDAHLIYLNQPLQDKLEIVNFIND